MASADWIEYKGKKIFLVDVSGLKDNKDSFPIIDQAILFLKTQPLKSVLLCTDITNTRYDIDAAEKMKQFSKEVTPHLKARGVTGITGLSLIIVKSIVSLIGQDIKPFKTRQDVLDYLVSQA